MEKETNIAPINEALNVVIYDVEKIKQKIITIRGKQVILDSDIAVFYEVETKRVNQAVKRNLERFPEDFCFQLTEEEYNSLRSQFVTSKGGRRYLPYVFTEPGVAMLSAVLHSDKAIKVSIDIIRVFILMRDYIMNNQLLFDKIKDVELRQLQQNIKFENNFDIIFDYMNNHSVENQKIFFDGQIYDAYSLLVDLIKTAKEKILIIDNYIDDNILKMLSKKKQNVEVTILTSSKSNILKLDVQKFNKEYPTLKVAKSDKFHDRFIVIDNKELYHVGASLKDLGKKCFAINKIEDMSYIERINEMV